MELLGVAAGDKDAGVVGELEIASVMLELPVGETGMDADPVPDMVPDMVPVGDIAGVVEGDCVGEGEVEILTETEGLAETAKDAEAEPDTETEVETEVETDALGDGERPFWYPQEAKLKHLTVFQDVAPFWAITAAPFILVAPLLVPVSPLKL